MILHTDRYFEHQYDVKWDMLCVYWPDLETIYLPELYNSVGKLIENVNNFNIRHLLIDASNSKVLCTYEEADQVAAFLVNGLKNTHLVKMARVQSADQKREDHLLQILDEFRKNSHYDIRVFKDRESAFNWLEQDSVSTNLSPAAVLVTLFTYFIQGLAIL